MLIQAYNHARLMAESESRVEMSALSHSAADAVARRVLENQDLYRCWTGEHDRLMRNVSVHSRLAGQVTALRSTAFALVHRRALFEYMRDRKITGRKRRRLLALFYGYRDYTNALLTEYGRYVRCSSSYVCTQHLAEHLMHDTAIAEPLQDRKSVV